MLFRHDDDDDDDDADDDDLMPVIYSLILSGFRAETPPADNSLQRNAENAAMWSRQAALINSGAQNFIQTSRREENLRDLWIYGRII